MLLIACLTIILFLLFYFFKYREELLKIKRAIEETIGIFQLNNLRGEIEKIAKKKDSLSEKLNVYTSLLEEMPVGVVLVNKDGKITFTNRAANRFLLVKPEDTKKMPLSSLGFALEMEEGLNKALTGNEKILEIKLSRHKSKTIRAYMKPLFKEGKVNGAVAVLEDLTELKKLEKLKQSLISDFSHELRTPLAALKSSVEALVDFGAAEDPEKAKGFLNNTKKEVENLANLVEKMTQLARLESSTEGVLIKSKFKLKELITEAIKAVDIQSKKNNIPISIKLKNDLEIEGDKKLLTQALINLLDNGIKYSPEGEQVLLEISVKDSNVCISVKDKGPGISKKDLTNIFRRFYRGEKHRTRSTGGVGLGLSLAKHIIEAHGGHIEVESEIDKGSTFTVYLPKE